MAKDLHPQVAVIFGATGDLTKRKLLPAFWHLWRHRLLPQAFALVGYARTPMTDEEFRTYAFDSITKYSDGPPGEAWDSFSERLFYYQGGFDETGSMNDFATSDRWYSSSASKNAFVSPRKSDWCVCMPDPFSPNSGFGMKVA